MRVLVLSSTFPSRTRPTYGVFVRERVRHVARHCELTVMAPIPWFPPSGRLRGDAVATTPHVETQDGLDVRHPRFLCPPRVGKTLDGVLYAASLLPVVARLRRRFPFDLIDAHFTYPDGVAAGLLGRAFRVPVVITVRGTHDLYHAGFALRRLQIRAALRRAARVVTVSQSLHDFVVALGVDRDRVRVIPNGVDASLFAPGDRAVARQRLGLAPEGTVLLSVAGLVEGKGHHRVIESLPSIAARHPDVAYVVVGAEAPRGDHARELQALARRHGVADRLRLVGPRPHDEIPRWMAAADVFCLATRSEGWCNAITEATACGLPVVSTRVGGNAEIVQDGRDGFLVPFWDADRFVSAVSEVLGRSWNRAEIAARAGTAGWEQTARAVAEEFRRALAPGRTAAPVTLETRA
jgi:glycosyltransferase involved in cell wall biosynthesis